MSEQQPRWREADAGLNLEGKCTNNGCVAFGEMVVMQMKFGSFDWKLDCIAGKTDCPCCQKFVQPITCGFINCKWKWTGAKG